MAAQSWPFWTITIGERNKVLCYLRGLIWADSLLQLYSLNPTQYGDSKDLECETVSYLFLYLFLYLIFS